MSDCVGCGYCCLKVPCFFGRDSVDADGRCGLLYWDGGKYRCRLAAETAYRKPLAIGEGCCSSLNTWRKDVKER